MRGYAFVTCHLRYVQVHKNEMTDTSAHDKQMEYLMGSESRMLCVENRKLQCIDNTPDSINDSAGQ